MENQQWTEAGEAMTGFILDVFRLNGRLLVAGDRLVTELGLTSARWQVLGAIAYAERPEPVAWHARSLGVHRQGIQRIVNELEAQGIVEFQANPHHKRAHLILLTKKGRKLFEDAIALQIPWVNSLSSGIGLEDIERAKSVLNELTVRLEQDLEIRAQTG